MKRTEIEEIARQLVRFVETHPLCSRQDAAAIIPIHVSTVHAWQIVQHLFDFDRSQGKKVRYSRNAQPFSFMVKTRTKKPAPWANKLAVDMQKLIDDSDGINGEQIRKVMNIDKFIFKQAVRLIKTVRKLGQHKKTTYYPFKHTEIAKYDGVILTQWRIAPPWLLSNPVN